ALEGRRLLAAVSFDAGGDGVNWNDPLNWSNDQVPTADDDVTLAAGGAVNIVGQQAVHNLTSARPLVINDLQLTAQLIVHGNAELDANVTVDHYRLLEFDGNLTLNATLTMGNHNSGDGAAAYLNFMGTADQSIGGIGHILSDSDNSSYIKNTGHNPNTDPDTPLTIGNGITISGQSFYLYGSTTNTFVNNGHLLADAPRSPSYWVLGNGNQGQFINHGEIAVSGSSSFSVYNLINDGTLSLDSTSVLNLYGITARSQLGTLTRAGADNNGGTVNLYNGIIDNTGKTFSLDSTTGNINLSSNEVIKGGIVNNAAGYELVTAGGTFDGVTLNSPMETLGGNALYVLDGLTLNSTFTSHSGLLQFQGTDDQTLSGTGTLTSSIGEGLTILN